MCLNFNLKTITEKTDIHILQLYYTNSVEDPKLDSTTPIGNDKIVLLIIMVSNKTLTNWIGEVKIIMLI